MDTRETTLKQLCPCPDEFASRQGHGERWEELGGPPAPRDPRRACERWEELGSVQRYRGDSPARKSLCTAVGRGENPNALGMNGY